MRSFTHPAFSLSIDPNDCYFDGDSYIIYGLVDCKAGEFRLIAVGKADGAEYELTGLDGDDSTVYVDLPRALAEHVDAIAIEAFASRQG